MDSKTINILGIEYTINLVDKFPEHMSEFEDSADGLFNGLNREIFIHTRNSQQDLTESGKKHGIKRSLRHEIIHAFLFESGLGSNSLNHYSAWAENEEMVDWFAIQLPKIFKVFQELDIL